MDRPPSLNNIEVFEKVPGVLVMVVMSRLGKKFIAGPSRDERPCIYMDLVDDDHYHVHYWLFQLLFLQAMA